MFPIMFYNSFAYVVNHYNIAASKKQPYVQILYTRKTILLIRKLYQIGAINQFLILESSKESRKYKKKFIRFSVMFYKNTPYIKALKLLSRPSKMYPITLKILNIVERYSGESLLILSTSKGLLTHKECLKQRCSGLVLCSAL